MKKQAENCIKKAAGENSQDMRQSMRRLPRLFVWLERQAHERGHSRADLAQELGVTYGYLRQLEIRSRRLEDSSGHFVRSCARYLDVPAVVVMMLCDKVQMFDFVFPEGTETPARQLAEGLERISNDPLIGPLMPAEVFDAADSVKALLVMLYEDATQQELFPPRRLPVALQALERATRELADLEAYEYNQALAEGALAAEHTKILVPS